MRSPQQVTSPLDTSMDSGLRKRVCKACDRCRLKKSKCDGASPCGRCRTDNAICVFGERKKPHDKVYPKGYVELLEQQQAKLVNGLQELYRRTQTGHGWLGSPLQDSGSGHPLTHDILERLGALKSDGRSDPETFEEDVDMLQQRLIEDGSGCTQRQESADSDSEHGQTPAPFLELPSPKPPFFHDPFSLTQLPPTPPMQSPYPRSARTSLTTPANTPIPQARTIPADIHTSMNPTALQNQTWATPIIYEENMHLIQPLEVPTMCQGMSGDCNRQMMAINTIHPRMAAPEWNEDDFSVFINPTIMA